jgi:hypothetical protein
MNQDNVPVTELHQVVDGGAYVVRDGVIVRVEGPTLPAPAGQAGAQGADGEAGAAVGAATGEPPSSPEATAAAPAPRSRK